MKPNSIMTDPIQSLSMRFFERLPFDLYSLLQSFLSHHNYRQFLATNKHAFEEIKQRSIYYDLNLSSSLRFIQSESYRDLLLNKVRFKSAQLSIHLSLDYYDVKSRYFYYYIAGLHTVNIKCFSFHSFIAYLQHISILHLENGGDIIQFPFLSSLKRITLSKFHRLQDISNLSHLEEVRLMSCPLIADVRHLAEVAMISLEDCASIASVCFLGKQKKLALIRCCGVTSVQCLRTVQYLTIQQCDQIADLDLLHSEHIQVLQLINCRNVTSIPSLPNIHQLTVQNCPQIGDFSFLPPSLLRIQIINSLLSSLSHNFSYCQSIKLIGCPYLEDVSALASVSKVHLEKCWKLSTIAQLGKVVNLTIVDCWMVESLQGLGQGNHRIMISQCPNIMDFHPLQAIPDIHFLDCPQPIDISCFSLARCLTLQSCPNIMFLSRLQYDCPCLQILRLIECRNVSDLHNLWKIPMIIIQNCPNLIDYSTGPSASFDASRAFTDLSEHLSARSNRREENERIVYEGSPCIHTVKIMHYQQGEAR